MATKSNIIPSFPSPSVSPMDLAREAAQQESVQTEPAPRTRKSKSADISLDIEDIAPVKEKRFTRTFTIGEETEAQLNVAASRLGLSKSAILEKAFATWWNAVSKKLDEKEK